LNTWRGHDADNAVIGGFAGGHSLLGIEAITRASTAFEQKQGLCYRCTEHLAAEDEDAVVTAFKAQGKTIASENVTVITTTSSVRAPAMTDKRSELWWQNCITSPAWT